MRQIVNDDGEINEVFYDVLLRGDHELNDIKTRKIIGDFRLATDDEIQQHHGCGAGFIGPKVDGTHGVLFDHAVKFVTDFICGANEEGFHLRGCHWLMDSQWQAFYERDARDNL